MELTVNKECLMRFLNLALTTEKNTKAKEKNKYNAGVIFESKMQRILGFALKKTIKDFNMEVEDFSGAVLNLQEREWARYTYVIIDIDTAQNKIQVMDREQNQFWLDCKTIHDIDRNSLSLNSFSRFTRDKILGDLLPHFTEQAESKGLYVIK